MGPWPPSRPCNKLLKPNCQSTPGVENLQGIVGHIARMIFSAGHILGLQTRSIFTRVQVREIFARPSSSSAKMTEFSKFEFKIAALDFMGRNGQRHAAFLLVKS